MSTFGQSSHRWPADSSHDTRNPTPRDCPTRTTLQRRPAGAALHSRYLARSCAVHGRRSNRDHRFRRDEHRHTSDRCGSPARQPSWRRCKPAGAPAWRRIPRFAHYRPTKSEPRRLSTRAAQSWPAATGCDGFTSMAANSKTTAQIVERFRQNRRPLPSSPHQAARQPPALPGVSTTSDAARSPYQAANRSRRRRRAND